MGVAVEGVGELTAVDAVVFVARGVLVGSDVMGVVVENNDGSSAPGVRKTFTHTGCVRMDGSRGSM
jgi:hypothetical protein